MTFKFFTNPQTLEELRKQYKALAMKHHPDCGGSTADMQSVNNEYDSLFAILKDKHTAARGATTTPEEDKQYNDDFKDIISRIIHFEGIEIEIIGSWVWVTGSTFLYKERLKELNFSWCKNKTAWAWHSDGYRKKSRKQFSMNELRSMFDSEKVQTKRQLALAK